MTAYEIPLTAEAQQFLISLGEVQYSVKVTWNSVSSVWCMDMFLTDSTPILLGIPLVSGADLLKQHKHLGVSGEMWVQSDGDLNKIPQYADLGVDGHLYFIVP